MDPRRARNRKMPPTYQDDDWKSAQKSVRRKFESSSQIHLRKENTVNQPKSVANFKDTSKTHLKKWVTWLIDRKGHYMNMRWPTSELHRSVWATP